jgi:hypothetical protein
VWGRFFVWGVVRDQLSVLGLCVDPTLDGRRVQRFSVDLEIVGIIPFVFVLQDALDALFERAGKSAPETITAAHPKIV